MKKVKAIVSGSLLVLSLFATVLPVDSYAGVRSDGVTASKAVVKSDSDGNYAYGYVKMETYHTTTTKLYYNGSEVRSGAATGTGKVIATTGHYTKHGTNLSARVFYK